MHLKRIIDMHCNELQHISNAKYYALHLLIFSTTRTHEQNYELH